MNYPRVTEVLRPFTSYEHVPSDILARAAARGTAVHALCAGIAKGAWIPENMIAQDYIGYVKSFNMWMETQVKEIIIVEKRYTHEAAKYTGQVDMVVILQGKNGLSLVDLKTSTKPQKTYPVQMSAYERLLLSQGIQVDGSYIVYLQKDGEFPDIDYLENLDKEFGIFVSALDCWHYFNRRKKDGGKDQSYRDQGREADTEKCVPENLGGDV